VGTDLRETVAQLLADLDGPAAAGAVCALASLPEALPLVAEEFHREANGRRRESLVHCLWQFRDPAALPTLVAALADPDNRVWKEALDGIVTLGGDAALRVLEEARAAQPAGQESSVKQEWIDEAIDQLQESRDPG